VTGDEANPRFQKSAVGFAQSHFAGGRDNEGVALPILPHELFGADCCGCLVEIVAETTEFVCNECGAVLPPDAVHLAVMTLEFTDASCPHCGRVNHITGFSEVHAFVCVYCGQGASL